MQKFFYDDEDIVGYSDEIADDIRKWIENYPEDDNTLNYELLDQLRQFDYDLVHCVYHPMGAWTVYKLIHE